MSTDSDAAPGDVKISTFGCRLNAHESDVIRKHAAAAGLSGAVVVNTCAVTAESVRQARQAIRKLRRENPAAKLIVTGCAAQIEPETFAEMGEVDLVLGNAEKLDAAQWSRIAGSNGGPDFGVAGTEKIRVDDIMSVRETAGHLIDGFRTRARAFVQVQNGCDHRCTFCVIPYGRGNSRSAPMGAVVERVRALVGDGCQEVVLTGVDMTSYGADLPGTPRLGDLLQKILTLVPDLTRLRLSSIDSIEADPALIDAVTGDDRVAPHLHLSLQAGHDLTLKRMKRRHLRADAIAFCEDIRARRPDMVFGADLIAGFPTETDEMFEESLSLIDACGLTWLHVFPYSPRPGTPAAKMPQVPKAVGKQRAARLRAAGDARAAAYLAEQIGTPQQILVERPGLGRTGGFAEIILNGAGGAPGEMITRAAESVENGRLTAHI